MFVGAPPSIYTMISARERLSWVIACLCLTLGVEAKFVLFNSNSGVTPPKKEVISPNTVWVYTSIAADYDGASMLPHFVKHYIVLGYVEPNCGTD